MLLHEPPASCFVPGGVSGPVCCAGLLCRSSRSLRSPSCPAGSCPVRCPVRHYAATDLYTLILNPDALLASLGSAALVCPSTSCTTPSRSPPRTRRRSRADYFNPIDLLREARCCCPRSSRSRLVSVGGSVGAAFRFCPLGGLGLSLFRSVGSLGRFGWPGAGCSGWARSRSRAVGSFAGGSVCPVRFLLP